MERERERERERVHFVFGLFFWLSYCTFGLHVRVFEWKSLLEATFQWQSRNFKTGGCGPGAVEFLGLEFVLIPLHTYRMFL